MNEKFPTRESTPVAGDSTEYFKAVFSEKNTGESAQDSHQAEFDSGLSAPESKEAGNNQPETGRGRNHNAPRGEDSRNTHNRKRAANYEAGRHNKDNQEQTKENRSGSKPLKESLELAYERGNESMAQQEKQRRQREYEHMEATDGGMNPEAVNQTEQNVISDPDFLPEQNNQNAPQAASTEGQPQQSPEQSDGEPGISVEDLLQSFDDEKDKTDNTQAAPDGETANKQGEPDNSQVEPGTSANIKPDISTQQLMQQIKNDTESRGNAQASPAGEATDEESELEDQTGQEAREASASAKPGIDIDRVVRQYQQHEGMSLENARVAAVDLAARIEGGSPNNMTAELNEFTNYVANPTNTTSSFEGNTNWYSNSISSADVANPKSEHTPEEADSVSEEELNTQESTEKEANSTPEEMLGEDDNSKEETNESKGLRKLGAFAVAGVMAAALTLGFGSPESRSNGESERGKDTNNPEVANDNPDMSEAFLAAGAGNLAENISSSIPGKEDIEEHTGVTIDETEDGRGYEVKAMAGTSGEELLEEVDNFANRIAKERLKWDIENISIAKPLLETAGFDVENLNDNIDDARTFVIDTEAVRKAALKVAKESPSGVLDTVNSIAG